MTSPLFRPAKRLCSKSPALVAYEMRSQENLPNDLFTENSNAKNQVYLVTCAHPTQTHSVCGVPLRAPSSYDHQTLLTALLDACRNPCYDRGNQARNFEGVRLLRCLIAAEYHNGNVTGVKYRHYHIALQAFNSFRFKTIKRALLERYGIATHWSTTHVGYWSALGYLVRKSDKKPVSCLDPKPLAWHHEGKVEDQRALSSRPTTASSIAARREKALEAAEATGQSEPKPSEIDVWPIIVRHDIRNDHDNQDGVDRLIRVAKDSCSPTMVKFLFKIITFWKIT